MNCRPIVCEERDTAFPPLGLEIVRDVIGHWGLKLLTFACRIRIKSLAPHVGMFPSSQKILRLINIIYHNQIKKQPVHFI